MPVSRQTSRPVAESRATRPAVSWVSVRPAATTGPTMPGHSDGEDGTCHRSFSLPTVEAFTVSSVAW
jgi:hypothetical protein